MIIVLVYVYFVLTILKVFLWLTVESNQIMDSCLVLCSIFQLLAQLPNDKIILFKQRLPIFFFSLELRLKEDFYKITADSNPEEKQKSGQFSELMN